MLEKNLQIDWIDSHWFKKTVILGDRIMGEHDTGFYHMDTGEFTEGPETKGKKPGGSEDIITTSIDMQDFLESKFYKNCRRRRKTGAKICSDCPFRKGIEQLEKGKLLYRDGEPCTQPGCKHHLTHPCEKCHRRGAVGGVFAPGTLL